MRKKIIFSLLILFATISFSQQFIVQSSTPANGEFGVKSLQCFMKQIDLRKIFSKYDFTNPIGVLNKKITGTGVAGSFQTNPFTIREKLDTVKAIAQGIASDAKLLDVFAVEGPEFEDSTFDGKVYSASYSFYSTSQKLSIGVYVSPSGQFIKFLNQDTLSYFVEVPANFIDSDSVFAICEANGGASFRSRNPYNYIVYQLGVISRYLFYPFIVSEASIKIDTTKVYWTVFYFNDDLERMTEGLIFFIDPVTGRVVYKISLRPVTAKEKLGLIDSVARGYANDSKLMYVFLFDYFGRDTLIDGKSRALIYGYKSPTKGRFSVYYSVGFAIVDTSWFIPFELNKPLTDIASYFDSPEILQLAELNGGLAFRRDSLDNLESVALYLGQVPIPEFSIDTSQIYWAVDYTGTKIERGVLIRKEKLFFFNPATGALVGTTVFTNVSRDETVGIPSTFALHQNYPNPFNPSTTISYDLPVRAKVKLVIYNLLGQEVATLVNGEQEPGRYNVKFDASGLPSGIYFYRLDAGKFVDVKKMILVK